MSTRKNIQNQFVRLGFIALVSLGFTFASGFTLSSTSHAEQPLVTHSGGPFIQLAAAQRYNFNRARYRSEPYYFRKKRKFRKKARRKSYKRRLKDIQVWKVDENNKDPIQLIVSRADQKIDVYKGSQLVSTSRVSSGKKGYQTPTGVFSILGKRVFHRSNIYSAAPMPYMQRLTWSGIALHASNSVPNYPASHGCVRLPNSFAPKLFKFTERGAHVIIADKAPRIVEFSGLDILKPLTSEQREKELEKIKAELTAKKMAELKAAAEKETLKKASMKKPSHNKQEKQKAGPAVEEQVEKIEVPEVEVTLSQSPIRILITRRLGRERIVDVQDMLRKLGFDPGESDGYMGKDTGKAILAFQEANGFKKTGAFSDALESQLYKIARGKKAPTGYIYVRQEFKNILSAPIIIKDPYLPLGTHLITAQYFTPEATQVRWRGMTLKDEVPEFLAQDREREEKQSDLIPQAVPVQVAQLGRGIIATASATNTPNAPVKEEIDPEKAAKLAKEQVEKKLDALSRQKIKATLARVIIPTRVVARLSLLLTPGSSIAISDKGLSKETTPHGTDFILLTR